MAERSANPFADIRVLQFLSLARVGRLATSDREGAPHNIPICFWFDAPARFYFIIDEKPKRLGGAGLKRMRNIAANPQVALVIDNYEEDWSNLAYVLVHGEAQMVDDSAEYMLALRNLRDKYRQYRDMTLAPGRNPLVRIDARRAHAWGRRFKPEPA